MNGRPGAPGGGPAADRRPARVPAALGALINPATAADWCAWARGEHHEGRMERARAGFARALALDPGCVPAAFGLASVLLDAGDLAGASALVSRMAAVAADRPDVLWLQARLASANGDPPGALDRLERLLRMPALAPEQRAEALLMAGLALGETGRAAEAWSAAIEGKRIQRALFAGPAAAREAEIAKLRRVGRWLERAPDLTRATPGTIPGAAPGHIFLLGFPRSGTTLLEQVLAAHPAVSTLEEAPTLAAAYGAFLSDADASAALLALEPDEAAAWAGHYWATVRAHGAETNARVFVDKQPAGTLLLPIIARLFPDARILFALRDPRDVVLSCVRQAFRVNAMTYAFTDLAETAACYDACMALAAAARPRLSLGWTDVRHEALVEDYAGERARILAFLGLAPGDGGADVAEAARGRTIRTPSANQVRAGLNRRGLGRWRQFERELAPVLPVLAPWIERFGYPP